MPQEAESGVITIKDDQPEMYKLMIHYLYHLDYTADVVNLADMDGEVFTATPIMIHIYMFALGDKYEIPSLRCLAIYKFKQLIRSSEGLHPDDLAAATRLIYELTPEAPRDDGLRDMVLTISKVHIDSLLKNKEFNNTMLSVGEFGRDLTLSLTKCPANKFREDDTYYSKYKCPACDFVSILNLEGLQTEDYRYCAGCKLTMKVGTWERYRVRGA